MTFLLANPPLPLPGALPPPLGGLVEWVYGLGGCGVRKRGVEGWGRPPLLRSQHRGSVVRGDKGVRVPSSVNRV